MNTIRIVICLLLFTVLVTGCGQSLNDTTAEIIPETEIPSQTETTITETETEATTKVTTTMVSDAKAEDFIGEWKCENTTLFISKIESHYSGFMMTFEDPTNTDVFDEFIRREPIPPCLPGGEFLRDEATQERLI